MKTYNGTIFNHVLVPASGLSVERSGLTPLARTSGKIGLTCPECGIGFERYACWAKRKKVCYCSKACADEARRRPTKFVCVVCAVEFVSIPSNVGRIVTCSKACQKKRKSELVADGVALKNIKQPTRKTGNKLAKLTEEQAIEIAKSSDKGSSLAAFYGVSQALICRIRRSRRKDQ